MGTRPSALLMQLFIRMATQICCGRESVSVIMFAQIFACIFMGSDGEYAVGNDWSTSFHFCVLKISLLCFPFFFFFPSIVFLLIVVINYSYYLPSPHFRSTWTSISDKLSNSMIPPNKADCTMHTQSFAPGRISVMAN